MSLLFHRSELNPVAPQPSGRLASVFEAHPRKAGGRGRVTGRPVPAGDTLQAVWLLTQHAFHAADPCPTPLAPHPPADLDSFPPKSVSPDSVQNSFTEGPKPEASRLPVTFPFLRPHGHTLHVHLNLQLPSLPPSSLDPAVALTLAL